MRRVHADDLPVHLDDFLILDEAGRAANLPQDAWGCCSCSTESTQDESAASCCGPPSQAGPGLAPPSPEPPPAAAPPRHASGCLVCGSPLVYEAQERPGRCHYCQAELTAHAFCERGHLVCDACHTAEAAAAIRQICQATLETDLIALMDEIRRHPAISRHGPEHHLLVPAVILTAYRNLGGAVTPEMFETAIRRGQAVPGGACGFMGVCGAAVGVGIAFSLLLGATPVTPARRRRVQAAVQAVLGELTVQDAARCCQRECWLALRTAATLSRDLLPVPLAASAPLTCRQGGRREDCLQSSCPLWPGPRH